MGVNAHDSLETRACPTSRIPTAAKWLDAPVALGSDQCRSLLEDLAKIADPRQRRGRRHALATVLAVYVAIIGAEFEILDPPDLAEHILALAGRLTRAAHQ